MKYTLGLDIGASKIQGILWDGKKVVEAVRIETPCTKELFLDALYDLTTGLIDCGGKSNIKGIGVAVAGVLTDKGVIEKSPNAAFLDGLNLVEALHVLTKKPVRILNDAKAFLWYELEKGVGKKYKNILVLTLGTGVGGAFSVEGKIATGAHGAAGELGHMVIHASKNNIQTLEMLASGRALQYGPQKMGEALGVGIANCINILDPEVVVLGGGLVSLGNKILLPARRGAAKHILSPRAKKTPILIEQNYELAGGIGAALLFSTKK